MTNNRINSGNGDQYDYIVVGAGSAGCVIANRLSADPACRTLLIEAGGPDNSLLVQIPAAALLLMSRPNRFNWSRMSEPQVNLNDRSMYWPAGRGWGGTSSINGLAYMRGHRNDYDGWAKLGLKGWSYANVLPYFKRAEDNARGASEFHGVGGPLHVSDSAESLPLTEVLLAAAKAAGHAITPDFNGAHPEGFGRIQLTVKRGRRWNTSSAYLRPALSRANLTVESSALVTRVLFEGTRATGVEFARGGNLYRRMAGREVVLCGGTVNTPQILLLSGVGDASDLGRHRIKVVADVKGVGQNLQDHIGCMMQQECLKPVTLYSKLKPLSALKIGVQYLLYRTGPPAGIAVDVGAFLRSDSSVANPDLQLALMSGMMTGTSVDREGYTVTLWHLRPDSRGSISLRTSDASDAPLIQPNYFSAPKEISALRQGIKLVREVLAQTPFDTYRGTEIAPGPQVQTDEEIETYLRGAATGLWHPVGTACMGIGDEAVVDAELRVRGVDGLRIADASVMPTVVSSNTNAPVIMIAEKAADLILGKPAIQPQF